MTLDEYLTSTNTSRSDFAKEIGVSEVSICRYLSGDRIPDRDRMAKIALATGGAVTPNDFFAPRMEQREAAQ
jgi:transcriptional regulator with XRE-family HTH domain